MDRIEEESKNPSLAEKSEDFPFEPHWSLAKDKASLPQISEADDQNDLDKEEMPVREDIINPNANLSGLETKSAIELLAELRK